MYSLLKKNSLYKKFSLQKEHTSILVESHEMCKKDIQAG